MRSSDYYFETGAVLFLAYMLLCVDIALIYATVTFTFLFAVLIPPTAAIHFATIHLWQTRPSVQK